LKLSRRVAHERLTRVCFVDFNREMALVAESKNPQTGDRDIIAIGRLSRVYNRDEAEFSLEVRDAFQRRGLGTELLRRLLAIGRDERIHCITAVVLPYNQGMLRVCERLGFHTVFNEGDRLIYARLELFDKEK
jgi:acetyltransferase